MVRVADKKDTGVGVKEVHDHFHGECDLPVTPQAQLHSAGEKTGCYYSFKFVGHNICSCNMCADKFERRRAVKKSRQAKKSAIEEQFV